MMDCTDRHYRYLARLLSRRALLYTEMLTAGAVLHGDRERLLGFHPDEHPLVLQVGGSVPAEMARAARTAEQWGYDAVNINVGCPSERVQSGAFGACLMKEPGLVADCVRAMRDAAALPVTVKHRIGVDRQDSRRALEEFVGTVAEAGCDTFIVHARNAWLRGLSPKQNREVPPLRYEVVHGLKRRFPSLTIVINGGLNDVASARAQLARVDGVMLGRAAYAAPWLLASVDAAFFAEASARPTRRQVLNDYMRYCEDRLCEGVPLPRLSRHVVGLFQGCRGARAFRRHISENAHRPGAGTDVLEQAARLVAGPEVEQAA